MQPVYIWMESPGPRARYAAQQLLGSMLGWELRWADSREALAGVDGPRMAYGGSSVDGAFHIKPCGYLDAAGTDAPDPLVVDVEGIPALFPVQGGDLTFDPIAATFFLLARVEEWSTLPLDDHGRPLSDSLHAARHGYLHRPVVDEWALLIADRWRAIDSRVPSVKRAYDQVATVDLDNGFKYLGRPTWRTMGSGTRDLLRGDWEAVRERGRVLRGRSPDPYLLDDEVLGAFKASAARSIAFVLAADRGEWDHAVPVEEPAYAGYLQSLATRLEIGVHPSYQSSEVEGMTQGECARLGRILDRDVHLSRQHFLRFSTPGTFRTAVQLGIREEHSMGLHDRLGFRAGTCTPYAWYDLERDAPTSLIIHPFAVMDNTLRDKLGLTPDQAVEEARVIIEAVRRVRGTFTGLWHESFLARTGLNSPWRDAILTIIHEAAP
ncbi:MAG: polysaccharide deacetylase family protein [Flavobacteriales bacterium]|nr:polysaccharide deacetylase family protein [Flavobacteriales bacterium]